MTERRNPYDIITINETEMSKIETREDKIAKVESLFNRNIDYPFHEFIGERYNDTPLSICIAFNHAINSGMVTIKLNKKAKTVRGSSDWINYIITRDKYKGVDA